MSLTENLNQKTRRNQRILFTIIAVAVCSAILGVIALNNVTKKKDVNADRFEQEEEVQPDLTGTITSTFDGNVGSQLVTDLQSESRKTRESLNIITEKLGSLEKQLDEKNKENEELKRHVRELQDNVIEYMAKTPEQGEFTYEPTGEVTPDLNHNKGKPTSQNNHQQSTNEVNYDKQGKMIVVPEISPMPSMRESFERKSLKKKNDSSIGSNRFYVPSGAFSNAIILEGADASANVTAQENNMSPMQFKLTGKLHLPGNKKINQLTGCFVTAGTYGDISSERAIVRTERLSCVINGKHIDQPVKGHVAFYGKNGIKGTPVMRNGKILGLAFGAGFLSSTGNAASQIGNTQVGMGASRTIGADEVLRQGLGGGLSAASNKLADYYIAQAEQYHPVIPIGSANRVEVIFQEGFWAEFVEDIEAQQNGNKSDVTQNSTNANNKQANNAVIPNDLAQQLGNIKNMELNDFVTPNANKSTQQQKQ